MVTNNPADDESLDNAIEKFYVNLEEARRRYKPLLAGLVVVDDPSINQTDGFKKLIQSPLLDEEVLNTVVSVYTLIKHLHSFNTQTTAECKLVVKNCLFKGQLFLVDLWTCLMTLIDKVVDFKQPCVAQCLELILHTILLCNEESESESSTTTTVTMTTIQQQYVSYQKRVLRSHCKSYIAQLVSIRREIRSLTNMSVRQYLMQHRRPSSLSILYSENHDDGTTTSKGGDNISTSHQPHADTLSNILSEASCLIHPLALWMQSHHPILLEQSTSTITNIAKEEVLLSQTIVQTCRDAISILDKEGQSLAVTVGNWLLIDYGYTADTTVPSKQQQQQPQHTAMNNSTNYIMETITKDHKSLTHMDLTLDEMSFVCQVISRYRVFLNLISTMCTHDDDDDDNSTQQSTIIFMDDIFTYLQELSLFYATTEIELLKSKFSHALTLATPVDIVLGQQMYVPSIVEDGYYITTRAIERAHATMCNRALSMVIHFICELWSLTLNHHHHNSQKNHKEEEQEEDTILGMGAIYTSLIERIGCKEEHFYLMAHPNAQDKGGNTKKNSTTSSDLTSSFTGGFATALLDALDNDDEATSSKSLKPRSNPPSSTPSISRNIPKAPSSGGGSSWLRGGVDLHQYHLDSRFCTLNGIQSAATACNGLVTLLDSITDEVVERDTTDTSTTRQTSMLDFSKAGLQSHSKSYITLLENHVLDIVYEYLGRVLDTSSIPPLITSLPSSPPLHRLYYNITQEMYNLDSSSFQKADNVKRLDEEWIEPLRVSRLVRELVSGKCDAHVNLVVAKEISHQVATLVLDTILHQRKKFTEWGSILLSRQVRLLEEFCTSLIRHDATTHVASTIDNSGGVSVVGVSFEIFHQFQRLKQAVAILQLEKPSDWTIFSYTMDSSSKNEFTLSKEEIRQVMRLRIDFLEDAIAKVCQ